MSILNGYCSLPDFKLYLSGSGGSPDIDLFDDAVIEGMIETASRRFDALCSRVFYPHVKTRSYDVPGDSYLWFSDDLLELLTLTNGDDTTIASTEYVLLPQSEYPKYMLKLRDVSSILFVASASADAEQVIDAHGIWGYREEYAIRGFTSLTTINEGAQLSASDLTITMTNASNCYAGQLIRIENELMIVASVSGNNVTVVARGENGSTAAVHNDGTAVRGYNHHDDTQQVTLEIARMLYRSRYGENVETTAITTPAGVIVTPRSLPVWANEIINRYKRRI